MQNSKAAALYMAAYRVMTKKSSNAEHISCSNAFDLNRLLLNVSELIIGNPDTKLDDRHILGEKFLSFGMRPTLADA